MARIQIAQLSKQSNVTRSDGAVLKSAIEQVWNDAQPVVLDFAGLRIASVSFFDEGIGLLAKEHGREVVARRLRIENIDPSDRNLLNQVVASRAREYEHVARGDAVNQMLRDAGIADDVLSRWDGILLALYQSHGGISASLEAAQRMARENAARGDWTLDLGHYVTALPRAVGASLKEKFDRLGITYQTRSLKNQYYRRKRTAAQP